MQTRFDPVWATGRPLCTDPNDPAGLHYGVFSPTHEPLLRTSLFLKESPCLRFYRPTHHSI
jgi:hypothetical protein